MTNVFKYLFHNMVSTIYSNTCVAFSLIGYLHKLILSNFLQVNVLHKSIYVSTKLFFIDEENFICINTQKGTSRK